MSALDDHDTITRIAAYLARGAYLPDVDPTPQSRGCERAMREDAIKLRDANDAIRTRLAAAEALLRRLRADIDMLAKERGPSCCCGTEPHAERCWLMNRRKELDAALAEGESK